MYARQEMLAVTYGSSMRRDDLYLRQQSTHGMTKGHRSNCSGISIITPAAQAFGHQLERLTTAVNLDGSNDDNDEKETSNLEHRVPTFRATSTECGVWSTFVLTELTR